MAKKVSSFKKIIKKIVIHPEFKSAVDSFLTGFGLVLGAELALLQTMDIGTMIKAGTIVGFLNAAIRAAFKAGTKGFFSYLIKRLSGK